MAGPTTFPKHGPTHSVGSIGSQNGFPSVPKANPGGARPGKPPYPHIDDIVSVDVDVDINAPVDKMLLTAETYLRQAESANTFGRPDLALKDYIRTNILVLDYIKKNKGWVSLQADSKGGLVRYQNLLRRIHALSGEFEKIKANIKADNAISHVQPTVRRPTPGGEPTGAREGHPAVNGAAPPRQNGSLARPAAPSPKSKPAVQPKPQSLHGDAVARNEDLAQRFARLRTNASSAQNGQDFRIRTQAIALSNAPAQPGQAPRRVPPPPPPSRVPGGLPKLPEAIYNPARGTVSTEAAELPSSAPRAMFTRTNSVGVVPAAKPVPSAAAEEFFVPAQSFRTPPPTPAKRAKATIPDGETISAEDLVRYMRMGAKDVSILLIDIRNRELFDEGHILSQATICLDPEVLMRSDISANEIADSMVLASVDEQLLFEKRHEFDLVVFYDQESLRITGKMESPEQKAISGLYNALIHYDFPGLPSRRMKPKLLEGGLDAWTGIVGVSGLQISSTSMSKRSTTTPMARSFLNRRQTYLSRPIQDAAEARRWEENLADMVPVRTKEDFLRRVVPIGPIQESMVQPPSYSPVEARQSPFQPRMSHEDATYSTPPAPPARPAPTLPRRSYSGLAETGSPSGALAMRLSINQGIERIRRYRTGFKNPGVHCFANSSLQALFATPGFARELWSGSWLTKYRNPPVKAGETMANPQLLVKALANIFLHLDSGEVPCMSTQILMDYICRIHSVEDDGTTERNKWDVFGGPNQQDAQEFYSFILANLHDETNMRRNVPPPSGGYKEYFSTDGTVVQNAMDAWNTHCQYSDSIIDRYFRGLNAMVIRCVNAECKLEQRTFPPLDTWFLPVAGLKEKDPIELVDLLDAAHATETIDGSTCERCKTEGRQHETRMARLPDRLAFSLGRFEYATANKLNNKVRFPIRGLDLTPYMAEPDPVGKATADRHYAGRMLYDCYAVTVHIGSQISGGHYISYVQDDQSKDPSDWWMCNDEHVERVKIGSGARNDGTDAMYRRGAASAYMVYYRRQGT